MFLKTNRLLIASLLVLGVAACAGDAQQMDANGVKKPASRVDVAKPKGVVINAYDADIENVLVSLDGMSATLDRMEGDIQTLTLKRIAALREEIGNTNRQLEVIQQNLADASAMAPVNTVVETQVIHASEAVASPQEVRGDMAKVEENVVVVEPANTPVGAPLAVPPALKASEPFKATPVVESVKKAEPKVEEPKKAEVKSAGGPKVTGARVGVHPDKVRVVLDVAGAPVQHVSHFDEVEKLLTIELPKLGWGTKTESNMTKNPMLTRYVAQASDNGSMIVFSMKDGVKASKPQWIAGAGNTPSRLIIDFTP